MHDYVCQHHSNNTGAQKCLSNTVTSHLKSPPKLLISMQDYVCQHHYNYTKNSANGSRHSALFPLSWRPVWACLWATENDTAHTPNTHFYVRKSANTVFCEGSGSQVHRAQAKRVLSPTAAGIQHFSGLV